MLEILTRCSNHTYSVVTVLQHTLSRAIGECLGHISPSPGKLYGKLFYCVRMLTSRLRGKLSNLRQRLGRITSVQAIP